MQARSTKLIHPSGAAIQTPLLISSFSSKGFRFAKNGRRTSSEAYDLIKTTADGIAEAALLSAYDIHHYYPDVKKLRDINFSPELTFIDSGGYETLEDFDFSEAYKYAGKIKPWNNKMYEDVLNAWPAYFPAAFVTYDHGAEKKLNFSKQIARAEKIASKYPNQLIDFLIKPERKNTPLNIDGIIENISSLSKFHIIGLTEKELGDTILQRMNNIKRIREALNGYQINAPIHIFGNLDPMTSVLYFLSGAEIFDGLTWLRFSFYQGLSAYDQSIHAIKERLGEKDVLNKKLSLYDNLIYMTKLKQQMRTFLKEYHSGKGDASFKVFEFNTGIIKTAFKTLYSI